MLKQNKVNVAPTLRGAFPGHTSLKCVPMCVSTPSSRMSTIISINNSNLLNDLVLIGDYLFPIHNNNINNVNDDNFTICVPHFSMSSIGSNHMMHDSNNNDAS